MTTLRRMLCFAAVFCASAPAAMAATGTIGPVFLDQVSIIALPSPTTTGHKAGNMEIKIQGGFQIPAGLTCVDSTYITTLASVDLGRPMFQLLNSAIISGRPVDLGITDDPNTNAYAGRCSLVYVSLDSSISTGARPKPH